MADSVKTSGPRKVYAAQFFARIGQRLVHIMSTRTPAGRLYEIDMRLRPSGNSGPLVTSIGRLQRYQREKAWTWEHQALVRARVIAGDQGLAEIFNSLRKEILCRVRDEEKLRIDIVDMREKMRQEKIMLDSDKFDLKQGHGGIVDIEFMVQYAVLRWANEHPQLTGKTGNIDLLDMLLSLGLISTGHHDALVTAYSTWMRCSYERTLAEKESTISLSEHAALRKQAAEVWDQLIKEST